MRSFLTAKGTELPILNLRGKDYLEVKYRLVWFREEHPAWAIETELINTTDKAATARAVVRDETGRIIATSHKAETSNHFPDFMEKAETGAIGRALALIGYGTQFCADELDEGERIVDAPATPVHRNYSNQPTSSRPAASASSTPEVLGASSSAGLTFEKPDLGDFQIKFGKKYMGKKLREIPREEIEGYLQWLESAAQKKGQGLSSEVSTLKYVVERYYQGIEGEAPSMQDGAALSDQSAS
ncbi:MAG: hypothetical protein H7333_04780 [Bdellovibrionales bacterium]|nr:hypothetical protein [Oligoflexia bacterium]